ncbi:MAG: CRISPR-associated protein Cas4 [Deltaproteobacteria bacterium]|nr:CRISPR-associated protein Cas4 [Deltaproteobacteria bacterium]
MSEELLPPRAEDWGDPDLIPISALEHYSYCPRQAALIHVEAVWEENLYTLRGRFVHELVDVPGEEWREGVQLERSLPLLSRRLGLVGKADIVEFHDDTPYPVDYKHGPRRRHEHDDLQLCAQAVCLEEMTGRPVPRGAIFHASSRRRREVRFDAALRQRLLEAVTGLRRLLQQNALPPPVNDARCRRCSLKASCLPQVTGEPRRLRRFLASLWQTEK